MSDINYLNINENFPVAGEDNDTQVFRDNFNTIKQSLQTAKTEIGDLQVYTAKLGSSESNDFSLGTIENAALKNIREHFYNVTVNDEDTQIDINYANGAYQVITVKYDINFNLIDFPDTTDTQKKFVGKMRLELYSVDNESKVICVPIGDGSGIIKIKKNKAFGSDSGDFWQVDGSGNVFFTISSMTDPTIIDIWRHGNTLFLNYLGEFY